MQMTRRCWCCRQFMLRCFTSISIVLSPLYVVQVVVDAIDPAVLVSRAETKLYDFGTIEEDELHDITIPLDLQISELAIIFNDIALRISVQHRLPLDPIPCPLPCGMFVVTELCITHCQECCFLPCRLRLRGARDCVLV